MSFTFHDRTAEVKQTVHRRGGLMLRLMLDGIEKEADPNTPKDTADLRLNKVKQVLGLKAVIQWRQKYAAIQEKTQFQNYTTPGTGPHFASKGGKKVSTQLPKYAREANL